MSSSDLFIILTLLGVLSPILISFLPKGRTDLSSLYISGVVALSAISAVFFYPLQHIPASVVLQFLFFQFLLFFAFVAVSRMRQRKSQFLHALMSIPSNGQWFITMWILSEVYLVNQYTKGVLGQMAFGNEFLILLAVAVAGALSGRMVGVQWMQWVEARWEVKTESVGSASLRRLDAYTPKVLVASVVICLFWYVVFYPEILKDVLIVMSLGFLQNGVYALNTRLANRNHPGWPVVTGLVGGVVFIIHWAYLISYTTTGGVMPLILLAPYTVATVVGSNFGALLSMVCERNLRLKADQHVYDKNTYGHITWHRWLLWGVAIVCAVYIAGNEYILNVLGTGVHAVVLPLPLTEWLGGSFVRPVTLLIGGLLFFISNVTHTLSSRAGNRNHALYHAVTCILHGVVYFSLGTFVILNAHFVDLIPLAALGSALGQLFAQRFSMRVEKFLVSVMDVPDPVRG